MSLICKCFTILTLLLRYLDKVLANKTCLAFIDILDKAPTQVVKLTFENMVKNLQQVSKNLSRLILNFREF